MGQTAEQLSWDKMTPRERELCELSDAMHRLFMEHGRTIAAMPKDEGRREWERLIRRELLGEVDPANVKRGAMLPAFHKADPDEGERLRLLDFDPAPQIGDQLALPGLGIGGRNGHACPAWMLELWERAGGEALANSGRGESWVLRLFIGALLHTPHAARDGRDRTFTLPARDVIGWLFPGGRWKDQGSRWNRLTSALHQLHNLRVPIEDVGLVSLVNVPVLPRWSSDLVSFRFVIPVGAASGARVHWPTLCDYGRKRSSFYRAYLSACAVIDHTARKGEPLRTGSGELARMVPTFTPDQLARMTGLAPGYRASHRRAKEAFEQLAADGHIELRPDGRGLRILGPPDQSAAMDARRALAPARL